MRYLLSSPTCRKGIIAFCYNMLMSRKFDALVVLGAGVEGDQPDAEGRQRVEAACELYAAHHTDSVIMTGNHAFRQTGYAVPEASAMKSYALEIGMPEEAIEVEQRGLDTIGNALFTKQDITDPRGWSHVGLITTESHLSRTTRIFETVMGPEYEITGLSAGSFSERKTQYLQEIAGRFLMAAVLNGIPAGDDRAIEKRLLDLVPGYKSQTSLQLMKNYFRRFMAREGQLVPDSSDAL